jgi:hypothetical protein
MPVIEWGWCLLDKRHPGAGLPPPPTIHGTVLHRQWGDF